MYIAAHSPLRQADVTEIRLGQTVVLLLRQGCAWPVELARQRLDARRLSAVLHGFRQRPLAVAQLRLFWICNHLAGRQLSDEALLVEFAAAVDRHRIEALVLPLRHGAVSSLSAAATGEAGGGPTHASPTVSATPVRTTVAPQPAVPVAQWDIRQRLAYVLPKAAEDVPGEALRSIILGLATPEGIAALALVIGLEVASHAAGGVGFFADAALVAVLWAMCGVSAFYAMIAFRNFLIHTIEARTDRDLDLAARDLADAAVLLGTGALTFLGGWVKAKTAAGRVGGSAAGDAAAGSSNDAGVSRPPSINRRSSAGSEDAQAEMPATEPAPQLISPNELHFSQRSAGGRGRAAALRNSMRTNGWDGPPIDAVRTPTGIVAIDNTRVAVAQELGIDRIPVRVWDPSEPLPQSMLDIERFGPAKTWGEALAYRTARQVPPLDSAGTPLRPTLPGDKK